ncbi:hypothetical protein [Luteimicrobium subarcticum]|uniref:Uncharacterized protein n=1 Tax=Luteimicrobium subarcticum TaxID=620910 RepID=A0A2M8WWJ4_9MICO|nr:hypothetical protein [Luteimicrobium subarcticum]PJI95294.1 hypothetical protein CLV34_0058 [Luteimicrobium subarcticum]
MNEHERGDAQQVVGSGDPVVDRELESLRDVSELSPGEQVAVFERVQAALQGRLVDADG